MNIDKDHPRRLELEQLKIEREKEEAADRYMQEPPKPLTRRTVAPRPSPMPNPYR